MSTPAPLAVIMISLNEAHNMEAVLENLNGFAREVFLLDSFSSDATVDIALAGGVHVAQRRFRGFGDQWNFALNHMPVTAPWVMKLDPDERLTDELKASICAALAAPTADGFVVRRRLWFMGKTLPVTQNILRIWRTGTCRFSDVLVNEYPIVEGRHQLLAGELEHRDSPNLHHWFEKQNAYGTAEALSAFRGDALSAKPDLFGSSLQRRMWLKQVFLRMPLRGAVMQLYCLLALGAWRAGRVGFIWAKLRGDIYRHLGYKLFEMRKAGNPYEPPASRLGAPHPRAEQTE